MNTDTQGQGVEKEKQVSEETHKMAKSIVRLADVINVLRARLEPVLKPQRPTDTGSKKTEQIILVPLAGEIHGLNLRISEAVDEITDILERLEI